MDKIEENLSMILCNINIKQKILKYKMFHQLNNIDKKFVTFDLEYNSREFNFIQVINIHVWEKEGRKHRMIKWNHLMIY